MLLLARCIWIKEIRTDQIFWFFTTKDWQTMSNYNRISSIAHSFRLAWYNLNLSGDTIRVCLKIIFSTLQLTKVTWIPLFIAYKVLSTDKGFINLIIILVLIVKMFSISLNFTILYVKFHFGWPFSLEALRFLKRAQLFMSV